MLKKFLYLDIDGVLVLSTETKEILTNFGLLFPFNKKAVNVLNKIIELTDCELIISSDWKHNLDIYELKEYFISQNVKKYPIDVTPDWSFRTTQTLAKDRSKEILTHVEINKPDYWCAVDDLNLTPYIDEKHFVWCKRQMEGIKQLGIPVKIFDILNNNE